jgi:hypothetical protein
MRLKTRTETVRVPGSRETRSKEVREWICPECDYFEDAEESWALFEESAGTRPKKRSSAGAERQQHFSSERVFEFLEIQRRFALIAEHLEDGGTAFLGDFHARVF